MVVRRFDVWLCRLDPAVGGEIQKTRPCIVASPDEANKHLKVVTIVPLTSGFKPYPSRVAVQFDGQTGQIAVDQIRTIDKTRMIKRLGSITDGEAQEMCARIGDYFAYYS